MDPRVSRRQFISAAIGAASLIGFDPHKRSWVTRAHAGTSQFEKAPRFDGELSLDLATRQASAVDYGHMFHKIPVAVLRPGSVEDVVKMVRFANQHSIKVALKGLGHSAYGQTQAEGGVLIDLISLNSIGSPSAEYMDVEPGALWGNIAEKALQSNLTPPVLVTCMVLTAGGTLSVGGMGYMSHIHGAQIDHVIELDVVTGDGQLLTCSRDQDSELFNMVLGGQGQCGIIVRARIRLVQAPDHVVLQSLTYSDRDRLLADLLLVTRESRFDHQVGRLARQPNDAWGLSLEVGEFLGTAETASLGQKLSGLGFVSQGAVATLTYHDYLFKNEPRWAAMEAANGLRPAPSLTMWTPASRSKDIISEILAAPRDRAGFAYVGLYGLNTRAFGRPLLRVPDEQQAFGIWLFPVASADGQVALSSILDNNRALLAKIAAVGGKRYAPYAMAPSQEEWIEHFGSEVWRRYSAAKARYDPKSLLSPGPGIFRDRNG